MTHDREHLEARYSNHFEIGQNAFEFLFDFGQDYGGSDTTSQIHTRIVTSPFFAKYFADLLWDAVHRYEEQNGRIPDEEP